MRLAISSFLLLFVSWAKCEFHLTVLHTNDVHSRFAQTSKHSGACHPDEAKEGKCYGGFARLHYKVEEIRKSHENVAYLSAGDYYQGTVWYTLFKWRIVSHFVNWLNHTAMAFGNHEFDDNIEGLVPFLQNATFPVVSCNINAALEPSMQGLFDNSVVVDYGGTKVGIIGFTTQETAAISNPGNLKFLDVVEEVSREAERLYATGVKILIAVGHAGYDVDMKVAMVDKIDAVVGGHTNTFLYHGEAPDVEEPIGDYPTMIEQKSGRKVPVVQAYAFGKYLGYLNLTFDDDGELTYWGGNPILLNSSVPEDPALLKEVEAWGINITKLTRQEVGKTRVFLEGSSQVCRLRECNLGNIIADAMVFVNLKFPDDEHWSRVSIALLNSGGIRASIDEKANNGTVTMEDVLTVLPFQNTIDLIEIQGKYLKQAFEFSVEGYDPAGFHLAGKFLQVSGAKVTYDLSQPVGSRVVKLLVRCRECRVPEFEPIKEEKIYIVAVPTYLATGGDGFQQFPGILDSDTLAEYLIRTGPFIQGLDHRITFLNETQRQNSGVKISSNLFIFLLSAFVFSPSC